MEDLFRCYITQSGAIVTGGRNGQQCFQTTRSGLDPSNRRKRLHLCIGWSGFCPAYHAHDAAVSLEDLSLATRNRNSASGIRTMHSPGPPAQEIAWRHGTAGCSTSCASHHAYPICAPKLGCVIHVGGCTTCSLDIGKASSHLPTLLYIHIRRISFLHRNIWITRYTCLSAFIVSVPANIDAKLHQCLTSVKKINQHALQTDDPRHRASRLASLRRYRLGPRRASLQLSSAKASSRLPA